jgi:hypothetical protein
VKGKNGAAAPTRPKAEADELDVFGEDEDGAGESPRGRVWEDTFADWIDSEGEDERPIKITLYQFFLEGDPAVEKKVQQFSWTIAPGQVAPTRHDAGMMCGEGKYVFYATRGGGSKDPNRKVLTKVFQLGPLYNELRAQRQAARAPDPAPAAPVAAVPAVAPSPFGAFAAVDWMKVAAAAAPVLGVVRDLVKSFSPAEQMKATIAGINEVAMSSTRSQIEMISKLSGAVMEKKLERIMSGDAPAPAAAPAGPEDDKIMGRIERVVGLIQGAAKGFLLNPESAKRKIMADADFQKIQSDPKAFAMAINHVYKKWDPSIVDGVLGSMGIKVPKMERVAPPAAAIPAPAAAPAGRAKGGKKR